MAGVDAELKNIEGKGAHEVLNSEPAIRLLMTFWAKHLKSGPPSDTAGASYVEISPDTQPSVLGKGKAM